MSQVNLCDYNQILSLQNNWYFYKTCLFDLFWPNDCLLKRPTASKGGYEIKARL